MMILLFLVTLAIGLLAQWHAKSAYARHSRTPVQSGYTGADATFEILRQAGITNVEIVEHEELLGDHYDHERGREPGAECRRLDLCGRVYLVTDIFPVAPAAATDWRAAV